MNEEEEKLFEGFVFKELDACGYFMTNTNRHYSMDKMIMDFACLYCMEHFGKNYNYKEVKEDGK